MGKSEDAFRRGVYVGRLQCQVHLRHDRAGVSLDEHSGWLYIHVAIRTTREPRANVTDSWKWNKAMEAREEMTMLKLVAKPFRMLSAYLMTSAVRRPPRTCVRTVAHALTPKFAKMLELIKLVVGLEPVCEENTIGASAGRRENSESWTFRTQRSPGLFFRTISK